MCIRDRRTATSLEGYTPYDQTRFIRVQCIGGGGGGGYLDTDYDEYGWSGGGGGGAYVEGWFNADDVVDGGWQAGAGGSGGTQQGYDGGDGGHSQFYLNFGGTGLVLNAKGGAGGTEGDNSDDGYAGAGGIADVANPGDFITYKSDGAFGATAPIGDQPYYIQGSNTSPTVAGLPFYTFYRKSGANGMGGYHYGRGGSGRTSQYNTDGDGPGEAGTSGIVIITEFS